MVSERLRMENCKTCGSLAELYNVVGGRFRVSCSATDCNLHGEPGTIDDWCPDNNEGPVCDTVKEAKTTWNMLNRSGSAGILYG